MTPHMRVSGVFSATRNRETSGDGIWPRSLPAATRNTLSAVWLAVGSEGLGRNFALG
jgi:hypothetical protein